MNGAVLLLLGIIVLVMGYLFYGRWLAKQWGIDPSKRTPAHEMGDGIDYVPSKAPVLLGHHFSSIAGAGPITGPIQAAVFGWIPVALWVIIGGIFFGAAHDFGSLFTSIRNKGQSIGEVISRTMGPKSKRLFIVFAYFTVVLVIAAFTSIVAGTFDGIGGTETENETNGIAATASISFILFAVILGVIMNRLRTSTLVSSLVAMVFLVVSIIVGNLCPILISENVWIVILAIYIIAASVAPVWILLQPRDFMCSFLLYGLLFVSLIGIFIVMPEMNLPGFTSFETSVGYLFPALFITVACGAISGFHSLVSSGTTSKQIDNEANALPIAYGGMLIECVLALIALVCVGVLFTGSMPSGTPTEVFARGATQIITSLGLEAHSTVVYSLIILVISSFALTSLDTATRLGRFLFQEFFDEGSSSVRVMLTNPLVSTLITVGLGVGLALIGYQNIWGLFGAANQLLAVIAILAVSAWLGHAGLNYRMLVVPMIFMLIVTLTSLAILIYDKFMLLTGGFEPFALIQMLIAMVLFVLAIILMKDGSKVLLRVSEK